MTKDMGLTAFLKRLLFWRRDAGPETGDDIAPDFLKPPAGPTVSDMVNEYTGVFALPRSPRMSFHDATHAMTGLGIGISEELRILAVEHGLGDRFNRTSFKEVKDYVVWAHGKALRLAASSDPTKSMLNGLENTQALKVQMDTPLISDPEIRDYFMLGRRINQTIRDLTGKSYYRLKGHELARIDFTKVNFADDALAIKNKKQSPETRAISIRLAKILRDAAKKEGWGLNVPRAGSSWVKRSPKVS